MIDSRINQVTQLISVNQLDEAEAICHQLEAEKKDNPYVLHALGLIDYMRNNYPQAVERFKRSIAQVADNPNFFSNLGEALRRQGKHHEALTAFQEALLVNPNFTKAHLGIANVLGDLKRYQQAMARFQFTIKVFPDFAPAYHYLGVMLTSLERTREAIPLIRKAIALKKDYYEAKFSLANALEQDGNTEEALTIYQALLETKPQDSSVRNNYANLLKSLGLIAEAEAHLQTALANNPNHLSPYFNLSGKRLAEAISPEEIDRLESLLLDSNLRQEERSSLHFTLAKYYEAHQKPDIAFPHFQQGNDLDQRIEPYDAETQDKICSIFTSFFTQNFFATHPHFGSESEVPVFIFGIPRSGTTLVEQILSSHSQVHGGGELKYLSQIVQTLSHERNDVGYPACLKYLDAIKACTLGESYVDRLKALITDNKTNILRITDKMPGNFFSLGLIALLLPKAKLINCRRNPMDSCLSCYTQRFTHVMSYSRSLKDLGHYYQNYERLMTHWHKVLPIQILDVQYEEMVQNPATMSRKIIDFVGLEWDDACLNFHENQRQIKTASMEQIRKPIYTTSVNKWRKYEKFLTPLIEALGEFAPAYQTV